MVQRATRTFEWNSLEHKRNKVLFLHSLQSSFIFIPIALLPISSFFFFLILFHCHTCVIHSFFQKKKSNFKKRRNKISYKQLSHSSKREDDIRHRCCFITNSEFFSLFFWRHFSDQKKNTHTHKLAWTSLYEILSIRLLRPMWLGGNK